MSAQQLLTVFGGLLLYTAVAALLFRVLGKRLGKYGEIAFFLVFYIGARYSLCLVPAGLVPYLEETPLYYGIFSVISVTAITVYLRRLRGYSWADLGWYPGHGLRDFAVGVAGGASILLPLLVLTYLTRGGAWFTEQAQPQLSPGMIVIALTFGLAMGGYLEEIVFRGYVFRLLAIDGPDRRKNVIQAAIFCASHAFYFPLDAHIFFYFGTFGIGLVCGDLRMRFSTHASAWAHGLAVFFVTLFPDHLCGFLALN